MAKVKKQVVETPTTDVRATMPQTIALLVTQAERLSFFELEILINLSRMMEWARIGHESRGLLPPNEPSRSPTPTASKRSRR